MRLRTRSRVLTGVAVSALAALPLMAPPAGAARVSPRASTEVVAATDWLIGQQEADGGFELADFAGFETPDAILALGAAAQPQPGWDEATARAAVTAVETGGNDPLDALDDQVDGAQTDPAGTSATRAQQAAKVIALVTEPLGLDATDFDPSDDTTEPVDLVAALEAGAGAGSDYAELPFGGQVFAAWARGALGGPAVPAPLLDAIAAAQQANGGFAFTGSPDGSNFDPDLTASVVIALALADDPSTEATLRRAVVALGLRQEWTGEWATEFDDGNPNSTAMVMVAAATLGGNPGQMCWRDAADPRLAGVPYPSPRRAIEARQQPNGRISSPSDGFGITTFATSQAIQGLAAAGGSWPYAGAPLACPRPPASRRLVNAQYADLLGRLSDEAGATYWVAQLDSDTFSPAQVARRLVQSSEYDRRVVDSLHRRYLDRPATAPERTAGQGTVRAGRRYDVAAAILGGEEYFTSTASVAPAGPPTAESWVEAVYPAVLGRVVDPAGRQWALGQLDAGRSRRDVARAILGSTEALQALVNDTYHQLLRRNTDVAGRDFWVGQIRRGQSPERLVLLIAGSTEYVSLTNAADS